MNKDLTRFGITCTWWAANDGQPPPAAGYGATPDSDPQSRRPYETRPRDKR